MPEGRGNADYRAGYRDGLEATSSVPKAGPAGSSEIQHALDALNAAMDKLRYGDTPESDLLEAHSVLDSLISGMKGDDED